MKTGAWGSRKVRGVRLEPEELRRYHPQPPLFSAFQPSRRLASARAHVVGGLNLLNGYHNTSCKYQEGTQDKAMVYTPLPSFHFNKSVEVSLANF